MLRKAQWLPSVLLLLGLIFLITPWSGRVQWKFEGDGRIFTRTGVISFDLASFGFAEGYMNHGIPQWDVFVTMGFPVELLCFVIAVWIVVRDFRTDHRPSTGCRHCGYDLRATPDRCPECGEGVNRKTADVA